jgi:hypothetical protein
MTSDQPTNPAGLNKAGRHNNRLCTRGATESAVEERFSMLEETGYEDGYIAGSKNVTVQALQKSGGRNL